MAPLLILTIITVIIPLHVNSTAYVLREDYFKKAPFNATCDKSVLCKTDLTCVSKRCQCKPGTVYESDSKVCWPILQPSASTSRSGVSCYYDVQCQAGRWGPLSRCNKLRRQCECFDHSSKGKREMTTIGGKCHAIRYIGDLCDSHEECQVTVEGPVQCSHQTWRCECNDGFIPNKTRKLCLPIAIKPGDKCEMDEQCQYGPFGNLSKCLGSGNCKCPEGQVFRLLGNDPLSGMCIDDQPKTEELHTETERHGFFAEKFGDSCAISYQCRSGALGNHSKCVKWKCECFSAEGEETAYHPVTHKCFLSKQYNESCSVDEECQASLGLKVKCGYTSNVTMEMGKVCYCPFGKVCRSDDMSSSGSIHKSLQICNLLSLATLLIILNIR